MRMIRTSMYLKLLNVLISCQEFPPDAGGIFDQVMLKTLIRSFLFVMVLGSNEQLHLLI